MNLQKTQNVLFIRSTLCYNLYVRIKMGTDMICFNDKVFTTKKTGPQLNRIKFKLISGIGTVGVYVITLSQNGKDVFDIYPAYLLKSRRFRKQSFDIVGVAESHRAAVKLVCEMIDECVKATGSYSDMRVFFDKFFA